LKITIPNGRTLAQSTRRSSRITPQQGAIVSEKLLDPTPQSGEVANAVPFDRAAGARILARSFYKELRASGYTPKQLLSLSTELIDLITQDLKSERRGAA
jgi:hypothetical protein